MYLEQQVLAAPMPSQAKAAAQLWSRVKRGKRSVHKDLDLVQVISPQLALRLKLDHGFATRFNFAFLAHCLVGPKALGSLKQMKDTLRLMMWFIEEQDEASGNDEALQKCFLLWFSMTLAVDMEEDRTADNANISDKLVEALGSFSWLLEQLVHKNEKQIREKARRISEAGVKGQEIALSEVRELLAPVVARVLDNLPSPASPALMREIYKERGVSPIDSYDSRLYQTTSQQDWRLSGSDTPERHVESLEGSRRSVSRPLEEDLVARADDEDWSHGDYHEMDAQDHVPHDAEEDDAVQDMYDHGVDDARESPEVAEAEEIQHVSSDGVRSGESDQDLPAPTTITSSSATTAKARGAQDRVVIETHLSNSKRRTTDEIEDSEFEDDGEDHNVVVLKKRVRKIQLQLPVATPEPEDAGPSNTTVARSNSSKNDRTRAVKTEVRQYTHWSYEELERLKELVPRFKPPETKMWGKRRVEVNWSQLKRYDDMHGAILGSRSQVQLKDKWRHISKTM
ncbi:hypothetical protein BGZ73_002428 [Actinomortierella ambigua]|nr:hypothetical protein BGZ73_002428 [Actinomortierella ambigua]